jgi:hypothetical protein
VAVVDRAGVVAIGRIGGWFRGLDPGVQVSFSGSYCPPLYIVKFLSDLYSD